jgi:glycyl-tRNA synthetase alpha subunit
MINYCVDEENKTITCTISGDELSKSLIKKLQKYLNKMNNDYFILNEKALSLKDNYTGIAHYKNDEKSEYKIDKGKKIARKKAFKKYNDDMIKKLKEISNTSIGINNYALFKRFEHEEISSNILSQIRKS